VAAAAFAAGPAVAAVALGGKLANVALWSAVVGATWLSCGVIGLVRFLSAYPRSGVEGGHAGG
jgi:hypothetical protein